MRQPRRRTDERTVELTNALRVDERDTLAGGGIARAVMVAFWVVVLGLYLSHGIVQSSDSVNNHVHVWYIADDLWHHGRLPWRMPVLAHGDAYAYPYGFLNWTTAALLWPLFGNWAVTLWTAVGAVGCLVATFVAFPEVRRGYWAAAALANPAILEALLFGQQTFAWASALLLFGIALWRRGHRGWAAVLVGVGQMTHPGIVFPIGIVVFLLYLPFTNARLALVKWYAVSCVMALPFLWLALASVNTAETTLAQQQLNFWGTLGPRVLIVVLPWFYALLRYTGWRWLGPAALAVSIVISLSFEIPLNVGQQWLALVRRDPHTASLVQYLHSPGFVPGATYRVLRGGDAKIGMYDVLRAGGRLDSELFPEGMDIKSFHTVDAYARELCKREVDQVLYFETYGYRGTDESALLQELAAGAPAPVTITTRASGPGWVAYTVDRSRCPTS